ncbi:UTP--glucose-1-phosphate uridylyltransferase-like protein [Chthoniobacter flavus Ellin428]|uniref:UTP--glucose-1-phosphate uridylyltransferase-like protein n=1 Tax=Chthoniobacter flavus Ellin428 TaxID=497964 RepID=B4CU31_9BACT|nr:UTP--glucose-1-phosphate uridylyltransferase [Chthoniobacter flavus]EDY22069.1 UTP--glucose-1-phosphate uridylyltransferase-like protein [Chthoniobacter flavus Ellin428]TCO94894.1 UDP-N-acetylglucosamine pyrophosphorylase [Chthoniobacter flavus]
MSSSLIEIITSRDDAVRNRSLDEICRAASFADLLAECAALDAFRRQSENLYERVRALFFLYAIHRFHLPERAELKTGGRIPFHGYEQLLQRRFEEAIEIFSEAQKTDGPSDALSSALAAAYHRLAFQTLADQVRRSVRTVRGNQWMFRMGHPKDQPLRVRRELLTKAADGSYPILRERTPVRMDLTHSAWSDIFFLGMDYPEGAKVLNVSVDLGVHGRDAAPQPPVSAWLRVIEQPVLRLVSVDLGARADISELAEVFDFAKDYLGLLKAAVIASGLVPPGIEGSGQSLGGLLAEMLGPGRGLELVSSVNDIPKGSRLAVSTNLLAALIGVCMRATGQAESLTGPLRESERRLVLARALLGEWIGGSGGGWQDSGGVWPGIKLIQGVVAAAGDPESGISRGRLMPAHHVFDTKEIPAESRQRLQDSLVLVHGGMAQNVGPILEMVTEKYLLRSASEWQGRQEALGILAQVLDALRDGDIAKVGAVTTRNFQGPIQTIIPWASTYYTERLIEQVRAEFGADFWGFWMLGGMSGGGMGFIFAPARKAEAQQRLQAIMSETKRELQHALPFAMEPVVYDFAINENGTFADLLAGGNALMPAGYYALTVPELLRQDQRTLSPLRRAELDKFGAACRTRPELRGMVQTLFDAMLPRGKADAASESLASLLQENGFDAKQHEQIRLQLREGRIGLAQNRLPTNAVIEDVHEDDVVDLGHARSARLEARGLAALRNGEAAVISLAAGAGSRWTQGAGVVKALHPFAKLAGRHRTFLETHLAKSRRISRLAGANLPHIFTTSYLTHEPTAAFLAAHADYGYEGPLLLSRGKSVGLRMVPTERDLRFAWEEMPQQMLDERQQKVRDSLRTALIGWARGAGESSDYTDNLPLQCLHPVGHWFEVPNLFRNGTLAQLLAQRPQLKTLLLHNIDTLGADVDPMLLGHHLESGATLTFEVITRRLEDRGGGLARVNGRPRLVEGLAMPREEAEFALTYYNTLTTWIDLDRLLEAFGLTREDFAPEANADEKITTAIRNLAAKMPTYVTLKDVKKRWGHGQEDIFPVTQFEKLWGDMSALLEIDSRFVVVPRRRGQQLKDQAQLDGWLRDGSAAYVESLCAWE